MISLRIAIGPEGVHVDETQDTPWQMPDGTEEEPTTEAVAAWRDGDGDYPFESFPDFADPARLIAEELAKLGVDARLTYNGICG